MTQNPESAQLHTCFTWPSNDPFTKVSEKEMPGVRFEGTTLSHSITRQLASATATHLIRVQFPKNKFDHTVMTPETDSTTLATIPTLMMIATTLWRIMSRLRNILMDLEDKSRHKQVSQGLPKNLREFECSITELIVVTTAMLCKWSGGLKKNRTKDNNDREQRSEKSSMKLE
jgi:hypothetical protein